MIKNRKAFALLLCTIFIGFMLMPTFIWIATTPKYYTDTYSQAITLWLIYTLENGTQIWEPYTIYQDVTETYFNTAWGWRAALFTCFLIAFGILYASTWLEIKWREDNEKDEDSLLQCRDMDTETW